MLWNTFLDLKSPKSQLSWVTEGSDHLYFFYLKLRYKFDLLPWSRIHIFIFIHWIIVVLDKFQKNGQLTPIFYFFFRNHMSLTVGNQDFCFGERDILCNFCKICRIMKKKYMVNCRFYNIRCGRRFDFNRVTSVWMFWIFRYREAVWYWFISIGKKIGVNFCLRKLNSPGDNIYPLFNDDFK